MPAFHKLSLTLNTEPLKKALKSKSSLFGQYPMRGEGDSPHSEMKDIWVRYNDVKPFLESGDFSKFADEHDSIWYPAYYELPELKELIFKVMSEVNGERLGGILITKLPPKGKIKRHTDSGWHADYYNKYYVPIENYKGSIFGFESGIIEPEQGEVYQFDNSKPHWVENNTNEDRIAMIICIKGEH